MWIRSQDEEILLNLDCITVIKHHKIYEGSDSGGPMHAIVVYIRNIKESEEIELGRYYSSQRIMEIFEEIEDEISEDENSIYYMPSK
jgi:hypothetical protein